MKKLLTLSLIAILTFCTTTSFSQAVKKNQNPNVDYRIDNMTYWRNMAKKGYVPVAPDTKTPKAIFVGSKISSKSVLTDDSPDVPLNDNSTTQSENSIFVDPSNNANALNSNNSTSWSGSTVGDLYGANSFLTDDYGVNWTGSIQGAGGGNSGDPTTAISNNGRMYVGFIHNNMGQGVSYSTNGGTSWTSVVAATTLGDMLDKNHLWIDNSLTSPYEGNVYNAWTEFGGSYDTEIGFVRSTNEGLSYSSRLILSTAVNAGSHNQGVNISTGPNGEVYVVWSIYDDWGGKGYEEALGFAVSMDGGETFAPATRIIGDLKGIRGGITKNQRVNSFPSMAVNQQTGEIYIVWTNFGTPGVNSGTNTSIYMIKSSDKGLTWSAPTRINQGPQDPGKEAYFPWIACDPQNGILSVVFYDDRNVSSSQVEVFVANSFDGGNTWEDFRVSDVAFTPAPVSGLAVGYMGDYLGISANGGVVYPVWPDNRNGWVQSFTSPFQTNNLARPSNLNVSIDEPTGLSDLTWEYDQTKSFSHFVVYRDGIQLTTTTELQYQDQLPEYGTYNYSVTAMHSEGESSGSRKSATWGAAAIAVNPASLSETLLTNQFSTKVISVSNIGHLGLNYSASTNIISKSSNLVYCEASGGGDEFISGVEIGSIINTGTGESGYSDYTSMSTDVDAGNTYDIIITNGNTYSSDDLGIWIDINQDGDFDDAQENVLCSANDGAQGTYSITIPESAMAGETVMRIRMKYSGSDCGSPCGTTLYGEVEDYTLNINAWLKVSVLNTDVAPGTSENVLVTFNSTDLVEGTYTAEIDFRSNDANSPSIIVPVTLIVSAAAPLASSAYSDNNYACSGSEIQLFANATGGSGAYTYSWTSIPAGFTSADENPIVIHDAEKEYFVEVNDGINTHTSSYTVSLLQAIGQANPLTGIQEMCRNSANTLYTTTSVDGALSYQWNILPVEAGVISGTGITGNVNWDNAFFGEAQITVSAVNNCGAGEASEILTVTINDLPAVTLSSIGNFCIDEASVVLTNGTPEGGVYTGNGISGNTFDPVTAGPGAHTITYTYDNGTCSNSAQTVVNVYNLPTVTLAPFSNVALNIPAFTLTGGSPAGGVYSGNGVSGGIFNPEVAGIGTHTITYTYVQNSCENSATQTITVDEANGISTVLNGISVKIYPNPNNGKFVLKLNTEKNQTLSVNVVNSIGMTVYQSIENVSDNHSSTIDMSDFSNGIYFIKIYGENINLTERIVIQK